MTVDVNSGGWPLPSAYLFPWQSTDTHSFWPRNRSSVCVCLCHPKNRLTDWPPHPLVMEIEAWGCQTNITNKEQLIIDETVVLLKTSIYKFTQHLLFPDLKQYDKCLVLTTMINDHYKIIWYVKNEIILNQSRCQQLTFFILTQCCQQMLNFVSYIYNDNPNAFNCS